MSLIEFSSKNCSLVRSEKTSIVSSEILSLPLIKMFSNSSDFKDEVRKINIVKI